MKRYQAPTSLLWNLWMSPKQRNFPPSAIKSVQILESTGHSGHWNSSTSAVPKLFLVPVTSNKAGAASSWLHSAASSISTTGSTRQPASPVWPKEGKNLCDVWDRSVWLLMMGIHGYLQKYLRWAYLKVSGASEVSISKISTEIHKTHTQSLISYLVVWSGHRFCVDSFSLISTLALC